MYKRIINALNDENGGPNVEAVLGIGVSLLILCGIYVVFYGVSGKSFVRVYILEGERSSDDRGPIIGRIDEEVLDLINNNSMLGEFDEADGREDGYVSGVYYIIRLIAHMATYPYK